MTARQNPLRLDSTEPITIRGFQYLIEGRQGSDLALFNLMTGETLTMTYAAVMREANLSDIPMDNIVNIREADAGLSPSQKARKDFLRRHIEEVAFGKSREAEAYRPGYGPESTLDERLTRKAAELAPLGIQGTSRSNLKKLVIKLKGQDSTGMVDGRSNRRIDPFGNIDSRLYSMLAALVSGMKEESTPTREQLIATLRVDWIKKYPGELDKLPSNSTLRRKLDLMTAGRYTFGTAFNRRSNESVPKRFHDVRPAFAPGEEVQVDSTPMDVLVHGDSGNFFRPTLTTFIDKATHSILAAMVTDGVKGIDLAYLLAKALSIPELRPGPKLPYNLNELRVMPWARTLVDRDLELVDVSRPIIYPRRIVTDLGKDYLSNAFLAACQKFSIDITHAPPATGKDKAIVERSHRTIKDMFVRHLVGFTGGSPAARGRNVEKQELISIHTLAYVLELWIRHIWQNMETNAIRNPERPSRRYSPNTLYEALSYRAGFLFAPISPNTFISLLPVVDRKIGRMGITFNNRRYDSPRLDRYRGTASGRKLADDDWQVHYDPNNPTAVWVSVPQRDELPDAGEFIECPWRNADAFNSPFSRFVRETSEIISQLGGQISTGERSLLSRKLVQGAYKAAEKELRAAEKREESQRISEEQGMARPKPIDVVEPEDVQSLWDKPRVSETYELFDPENSASEISKTNQSRPERIPGKSALDRPTQPKLEDDGHDKE
ncbi:Mu transposase C-terminal domain-containing protein [Paeniglutamicibacter kerguelensis]|nr:Mu transposase C-terminal domain-containing protein [Paeniglutamicibacter kerguelensis]